METYNNHEVKRSDNEVWSNSFKIPISFQSIVIFAAEQLSDVCVTLSSTRTQSIYHFLQMEFTAILSEVLISNQVNLSCRETLMAANLHE